MEFAKETPLPGYVYLLQQVAVAANEATSVGEALGTTLRAVCIHTGWPVGHVYVPAAEDPALLQPTDIWYLADPEAFTSLRAITAATTFRRGEGLPGAVLASGRPAWIADVCDEPSFLRARGADLNIHAAFALPVLVGDEVTAVLEFFSREVARPDDRLLQVSAQIGTQLGRIVERERAAAELRERSAQLAEAQRLAGLGNWEWDIVRNQISWSEEMYRILGVDPAAFHPSFEAVTAFYHPDDVARVLLTLRTKALAGGMPYELEYRIVRPDGQTRTIYSRSLPETDEAGSVVRLVGTWQDITEIRRAEETSKRLLQLSEKLNVVLEPRAVLDTLAREAISFVEAESGFAALMTPDGLLAPTYFHRGQPIYLGKVWARDEGIPGYVATHREAYIANNAADDPLVAADLISRFGVESVLCKPILDSRNQLLGIFEVNNKRGGRGFSEEDQRKLTDLSGIAAIALQNAQLYSRQRELSRQVVVAQEEERRRLSRELHDSAGQMLTALSIQLSLLATDSAQDEAELRQHLQEVSEMVGEVQDEIRSISHALRPPHLELSGLDQSLRGLCADFAQRAGLDIAYEGLEVGSLPDQIAITFYRFLQETLSNVGRHANASRVEVRLTREESHLALQVTDDGIGFYVGARLPGPMASRGVGLLGLKERFELLQGQLLVQSAPGQGTTLTGRCPLPQGELA